MSLDGKMIDGGQRIIYDEGSAHREPTDGKGRPDLITPFGLTRISKWYELGSKKYGDRNWERGMPFSRYTASMFRHIIAWMKGDETEDHLSAIAWNAMAIIHHQELGEFKWDDMPHYLSDSNIHKNNEEIKDLIIGDTVKITQIIDPLDAEHLTKFIGFTGTVWAYIKKSGVYKYKILFEDKDENCETHYFLRDELELVKKYNE